MASRNAVFKVRLARAVLSTVSVDYATVAGTAVETEDYTPVVGTLTFLPGETEKEVIVPLREGPEDTEQQFTLLLSNASKAKITRASGVATLPAESAGLEGFFPNNNLGVLFYQGEKHPGEGGTITDSEWPVAPLDATQDTAEGVPTTNPYPGYMGEFVYNAAPGFTLRASEPIHLPNGWWVHYLVAASDQATQIAQILFGDAPMIPSDQLLTAENKTAFNAWWSGIVPSNLELLDASDNIMYSTPMPGPYIEGETAYDYWRVISFSEVLWPATDKGAIAKMRITPI